MLLISTIHMVEQEISKSYALGFSEFQYKGISISLFRRWLKYLQFRYKIVSLPEGILQLREPGRDLAAITFDDGYESIYRVAFPILYELKVPMTIFLATDYIGENWRAGNHNDGKQMLSWSQIREMNNYGCSFGAHTCSHPVLRNISDVKALDEIARSKKIIEDQLGKAVSMFAYPFGYVKSFLPKHEKFVEEAGFRFAFSMIEGFNRVTTNPWALRRVYPSYPTFVMETSLIMKDLCEQFGMLNDVQEWRWQSHR